MLFKLALIFTSFTLSLSSYAQNMNSCGIEVAVSTPPIEMNQQVAFNITNYDGVTKSITLKGGSAPYIISELPCSNIPYFVSATLYNTSSNESLHQPAPIGQCTLKVGSIILGSKNNSASVVFPHDFIC